MEGNLITTAARKGLLEYPGCVDAQEAMEHQLLYHVWSNAWSPLVGYLTYQKYVLLQYL